MAITEAYQTRKTILKKAKDFVFALKGQPLSHVWRGHGTALFLEFGDLSARLRRDGTEVGKIGAVTVGIQWDWRLEKSRSILVGSRTGMQKCEKAFVDIIGSTVIDLQLIGTLPEISIVLSSGHRVLSFMTDEGQPSWAITINSKSSKSLLVKRGYLCVVNG